MNLNLNLNLYQEYFTILKNNNKKSRKQRSDKFPLTLHKTGQYCKKINGKLYYFGVQKHQALQRYLEQAAYLHAGKHLKADEERDKLSLKTLCNLYLEHQKSRVQAGEIKLSQVYDQTITLRDFVKYVGPGKATGDVTTIDLQNYKSYLVKQKKSATRINNHISAFKAMYHWAFENELISKTPNLGAIKKLPRPTYSRPIFTPDEIQKLLDYANSKMKAMIWLGLNCGFVSRGA